MANNFKKALLFGLLFEIVAIGFFSIVVIFPNQFGPCGPQNGFYGLLAFIGIFLNIPTIILVIIIFNFVHLNDIVFIVSIYILQASFMTWIRYRYLNRRDQKRERPDDWVSRIEDRWK